jgi:hypothetical protein
MLRILLCLLAAQEDRFDFDSGAWEFVSDPENSGPRWAIDNSPAVTAPLPSSNLNYNNGSNYVHYVNQFSVRNAGTATLKNGWSIVSFFNPKIRFECWYYTETEGTYPDVRTFSILAQDGTVLSSTQLSTDPGSATLGPCAARGVWHYHEMPLQKSWGTVRFRFSFDTINGVENDFAGWHIENLKVVDDPWWGHGSDAPERGEGENGDNGCGGRVAGPAFRAWWLLLLLLPLRRR